MDINMIKKLIELDKKACQQIEEMESEKLEEEKEIELGKDRICKKYEEKAANRLSGIKKAAAREEMEKRRFYEEKFAEASLEMKQTFEENKEEWANQIFESVIKL